MTKKNTPLSGRLVNALQELEKESAELQAWFEELRELAGLTEQADRGRVAASLKAKLSRLEELENFSSEVANHYGYKKWGNFVNSVRRGESGG